MPPKIILASKSPRRSEILKLINIRFEVIISHLKEDNCASSDPITLAKFHAQSKASHVAKDYSNAIIIGADTIVVCEGKIFCKPKSLDQAKEFFKFFSGKQIEVYTGVALCYKSKIVRDVDKSYLNVSNLSEDKIQKLISMVNPLERAGGFTLGSVQAVMFDDIKGSYYNILGLPVKLLSDLFSQLGFDLLEFCH